MEINNFLYKKKETQRKIIKEQGALDSNKKFVVA